MHDLIVVSDLHLGRGRNPDTGRFFSLEAFFYDDDFARFCRWLCDRADSEHRPFKLILNGDTFDFLRIESNAPGARPLQAVLAPPAAAKTMAEILAGHPTMVRAWAEVVARGHEVVFLPGNHDLELQWPVVHDVVRAAVRDEVNHAFADRSHGALDRLTFAPWFHYEPNRIWIEHGCQYDPENSFRFLLRRSLMDQPDIAELAEQDLPLGNFFQRYLYNDFGHITFIVPSSRANLRYMRWLLANQPRLLLVVVLSHLPFLVQVLRRVAKAMKGAGDALKRSHERELAELAQASGLGRRLYAIDALKQHRANAVQAAQAIGWQALKMTTGLGFAGVVSASLWFVAFMAINQVQVGFTLKTLMFLTLNVVALMVAIGGIGYSLLRQPAPAPMVPVRRAAERIGRMLDVPLVTFGHTHDEVVWPFGEPRARRGWYFNTGTWIAVFTHDVLLPRERVQYTFLEVRGTEGSLLQWSPGRGEARPVVLLEERYPWTGVAEGPPTPV